MVRNLFFLLTIPGLGISQIPVNEQKNSNPRYYYEQGEELFRKHAYEDALVFYNQSIILNPLYADAYYARAVTKEKLEDVDGALVDYTLACELQPTHFESLLGRAILRFKLEKWSQAELDFRVLLTMPPGETTSIFFQQDAFAAGVTKIFTAQGANDAYLHNYLALTLTRLNKFDSAIVHFDSAFLLSPEADYLVNKGICLQSLDKAADAKEMFERALQLDPDNGIAKHNLGVLSSHQGEPAKAEQWLNDAIDSNPHLPYPYAERAYYELMSGDFIKSIADYSRAIEIDPRDAGYWLNRGIAKEKISDWAGAFSDYSAALQLDKQHEKAWFNRGNLMYRLRKYEEAIKDYDIAIQIHPAYGHAYYNRALSKHYLSMNDKSCDDLNLAAANGFDVNPKVRARICQGHE
jgi:tetratricopeptide (TPR) repeat protein